MSNLVDLTEEGMEKLINGLVAPLQTSTSIRDDLKRLAEKILNLFLSVLVGCEENGGDKTRSILVGIGKALGLEDCGFTSLEDGIGKVLDGVKKLKETIEELDAVKSYLEPGDLIEIIDAILARPDVDMRTLLLELRDRVSKEDEIEPIKHRLASMPVRS